MNRFDTNVFPRGEPAKCEGQADSIVPKDDSGSSSGTGTDTDKDDSSSPAEKSAEQSAYEDKFKKYEEEKAAF
jgi:hypothetical protein